MPPTEFKGFILTRRSRDVTAGTEIEYWLATDAGPRKVILTSQTSVAFVETKHRASVEAHLAAVPGMEVRQVELKTFHQTPVVGVYAKHFRQLGQLARALRAQSVALLEADVRPHDRFLMERFITAGVLVEGGRVDRSTIVDCKLKPAPDFRPVLKVVSLDIETSQDEELYSIALDGTVERVVFMLGEPPPESGEPLDFSLIYCPTRKAMLEKLNDWFEERPGRHHRLEHHSVRPASSAEGGRQPAGLSSFWGVSVGPSIGEPIRESRATCSRPRPAGWSSTASTHSKAAS